MFSADQMDRETDKQTDIYKMKGGVKYGKAEGREGQVLHILYNLLEKKKKGDLLICSPLAFPTKHPPSKKQKSNHDGEQPS